MFGDHSSHDTGTDDPENINLALSFAKHTNNKARLMVDYKPTPREKRLRTPIH